MFLVTIDSKMWQVWPKRDGRVSQRGNIGGLQIILGCGIKANTHVTILPIILLRLTAIEVLHTDSVVQNLGEIANYSFCE